MAFKIYPDAATAVLLATTADNPVPSTKFTTNVPVTALAGPDGATGLPTVTFIRISMSNPASLLTLPKVDLLAVNSASVAGPAVTITATSVGTAQSLKDGSNPIIELGAAWFDGAGPYANNVYLLKIATERAGTTYQIKITSAGHDFVWVVADSDVDSQQPWIKASPASLSYNTLTGQKPANTQQAVVVDNRGTGSLTVSAVSPALPAAYGIVPPSVLPVTIDPNPVTPANVMIGFTSATAGATALATFSLAGDSSAVPASAGHNNQFTLDATTRKLEVAMVLDYSGSMAATDTSTSSSRWSELSSAAKLFLEGLSTFGAGTGNYGILKFPGGALNDLTSYDVVPSEAIPADMTKAKAAIDALKTPFNSTPMEPAIKRALTASAPAYFDPAAINSSDRWMLLMSDGAWNQGVDPRNDIASLTTNKIVVYTAGYGTAGQVDYATLKALATSPSTTLQVDIGSGLSAQNLADKFKLAIKEGLTSLAIHSPGDPADVLTASHPENRHAVVIVKYDTKAVFLINWNTPDVHRMVLQIQTPTCDLLTPESAAAGRIPGVSFRSEQRYQMYVIDESYLRNDADPSHPRAGTWHMIVSSPELVTTTGSTGIRSEAFIEPNEHYSYDVMVQSALKMDVSLDRKAYFAGDPITVTAKLSLNGVPLSHASVKLDVNMPTQAVDNWLAGVSITAEEYQSAANQLAGKDFSAVYIKAFAAGLKGISFVNKAQTGTLAMTDPDGDGIYSATVTGTSTPDNYKLYITAVGSTPDGVLFRRERGLEVRVGVRPDPIYTRFNISYLPAATGTNLLAATVTVTPRDRFGNVVLIDPATSQEILLSAQGATLDPKLATSFNGTYSSNLTYAPGSTPSLSLTVGGTPIVTGHPVAPVDQLRWVSQVLKFEPGVEAAPGANQHAHPNDVLGSPLTKPPGAFVSLGGYGSVTVGIDGQVIVARSDDDVTVFVQPDDDLRSYLVEALPSSGIGDWVQLGTSPGTTSSFSLARAKISAASAIRITDESGRARDGAFKPSPTPGVSIRAVGLKSTAAAAGGLSIGCERFFIGFFSDGGVASVANFADRFVSPVDKHAYHQAEVTYEYYLHSTRLPPAPFTQGQQTPPGLSRSGSGAGNLLYMFWDVEDATGHVSLQTSYFVQGGAETPTHDGCVKVYAVCQRRTASLT